MHFHPKDISVQIIYHLNPHPHPHHIRDKESRYLYMNLAMSELLNVPQRLLLKGKGYLKSTPPMPDSLKVSRSRRRGSCKDEPPPLY